MNLFVSMVGVGLITSIHCVFMCGGLVLTCAVKGVQEGPWYRRLTPHLVYQGAKITSYATVALVLGAVVALLGRAVDITGFRNWLLVVAGLYMILLGLGMTGKFKLLRHLSPRPPKFLVAALSRNRRRATADAEAGRPSLATPLVLGALTGFMPCAPLIAAQVAAVSSGSPASAAFAMIGFGLGTAPLMLAFGFGSSMLSRAFQNKIQVVAALAILIFGLVIFNRGLMIVGSPVTYDTLAATVTGSAPGGAIDGFKKGADGVAEIPVTIRNTEYVPKTVVVPADRPSRLIVDRQEDIACSGQIAIPSIGVLADLKPNAVTAVSVPAMKTGSYTLTCGMGMMSGTIVAAAASGGSVTATTGPSLIVLVVLVLFAVALMGHVWRTSRVVVASPTKRGAPAEPEGPKLLGMRPVELAMATVIVAAAIILGLALGNFIR